MSVLGQKVGVSHQADANEATMNILLLGLRLQSAVEGACTWQDLLVGHLPGPGLWQVHRENTVNHLNSGHMLACRLAHAQP